MPRVGLKKSKKKEKYLDKDKERREKWSLANKGAEIKFNAISGIANLDGSDTTGGTNLLGVPLSIIPQGTTVGTRIGNQVRFVGLRGSITLSRIQPTPVPIVAGTTSTAVASILPTKLTHHVAIVLDRQANQVAPVLATGQLAYFQSVFDWSALQAGGQLLPNWDNRNRFDVLFSKSVVLHDIWQATKHIKWNINLDLFNTTYSTTGANPTWPITNGLMLFIVNAGDAPFEPETNTQFYWTQAGYGNHYYFIDT